MFDKRKVIVSLVSIAVLFAMAKWFGAKIQQSKEKPKTKVTVVNDPLVKIKSVENQLILPEIITEGKLNSAELVTVSLEGKGTLQSAVGLREGAIFQKGQKIAYVIDDQNFANYQAAISKFQQLLTSAMVDVEMEYPESKTKWQSFLNQIKNNQLPALPNESNERLSNFLSSKGIFNAYYDLKALQTSLSKRSFVAPFTGYVVNVYLQDGSFVTGNSKICDIAPTSKLEVDFNVSEEFASQLSVGSTVFVGDRASKIVRIGNQINNVTQQKKFTAQLLNVGGDLLAGDFVKIKIPLAKKKIEAMVLPVYCLDKNSLYQIQKDSSLTLKNITIVGEKNDSVFVSGLQKGDLILNEAFSNFKNGQKVRF